MNEQQRLLRRLVVPRRGECDAMIEVEVVVVVHVSLDRVQIDVHVIELLHQEVARSHALSPWNRVAFVR